ncbi:hypothetical protein [Myroides pelagicus]|uniref:Uncharacterized protein n=1 Tax=Myroides pelagicus TaxID=270914 RepID=A0A7K1GHB2_9FLAO|nr:hypothetical protein [Myroides pelagicus]MEC4113499.1 hypothetical protein [Myroides pelagicus]MTH28336.1 hypothetical protein [Myroides pelagicus]
MKLRAEILPNFEVAKERYDEVLKQILDYTAYCDEYEDQDQIIYNKIAAYLAEITGKDISVYNLYEWWEEEEAQVLAFRIALPAPITLSDITMEELRAVISKIRTFDTFEQEGENLTFEQEFSLYLDDYYHAWLKLNFKKYKYSLFNRYKNSKGEYLEYSIDELVNFIY